MKPLVTQVALERIKITLALLASLTTINSLIITISYNCIAYSHASLKVRAILLPIGLYNDN